MATTYAQPRFAPLPDSRITPKWGAIADQLRARPYEWAAVAEQDTMRSPLSKARLERFEVETTVRSNGDGTATVWMRHVPATPTRIRPGELSGTRPVPSPSTHMWWRGQQSKAAA